MTPVAAAMPPALASLPADLLVDVDVREDLRHGREPFSRIMIARAALQPGQVLRVRAIFEPAPLYRVLGAKGLDHWTERLAADDWRVWFFEAEAQASAAPARHQAAPEPAARVLDVRGMEPPEPMMRTLAALEQLAPGETLVQLNVRAPKFLFPRLEELGFSYEVRDGGDGVVRTLIHRAARSAPEGDFPQLDVRAIPPHSKHRTIFETFDALELGRGFILVNDHDPIPLRHQFTAQRPGAFGWEYLERGPAVFRVLISKP